MQDERVATEQIKLFRLLTMFVIGMFILSISLPQQVAFAEVTTGNGKDWQLEMLGADKAHEDGHKGQGIKIGIVDENFDAGTHRDVVQRVVKHAAPSASISTYNTYKDYSTTTSREKVIKGVFAVTLHYNVTESTTFTMTLNNEDNQNETNLTVEGKANDPQVKSSSADFKNLKKLDGKTLQGEFVE